MPINVKISTALERYPKLASIFARFHLFYLVVITTTYNCGLTNLVVTIIVTLVPLNAADDFTRGVA